jgi:hypothetical protein
MSEFRNEDAVFTGTQARAVAMESLKRPGADALPKTFHSEAVVATIQTVLRDDSKITLQIR